MWTSTESLQTRLPNVYSGDQEQGLKKNDDCTHLKFLISSYTKKHASPHRVKLGLLRLVSDKPPPEGVELKPFPDSLVTSEGTYEHIFVELERKRIPQQSPRKFCMTLQLPNEHAFCVHFSISYMNNH